MTKNPPVYQENTAFQLPIHGNRHRETQQANAARVRICRVSNLHAYVELTLYRHLLVGAPANSVSLIVSLLQMLKLNSR